MIRTKPVRAAPPPIRRQAGDLLASLAKRTGFADPRLTLAWPDIAGPALRRPAGAHPRSLRPRRRRRRAPGIRGRRRHRSAEPLLRTGRHRPASHPPVWPRRGARARRSGKTDALRRRTFALSPRLNGRKGRRNKNGAPRNTPLFTRCCANLGARFHNRDDEERREGRRR